MAILPAKAERRTTAMMVAKSNIASTLPPKRQERKAMNWVRKISRCDRYFKYYIYYIFTICFSIKARIRKSKRAFERVIDDIEERVLLQEKLDEKKLQYHRKLEQERLDAARQPNAKADASTAEDATTAAQSTATDKLQQFSSKLHSTFIWI